MKDKRISTYMANLTRAARSTPAVKVPVTGPDGIYMGFSLALPYSVLAREYEFTIGPCVFNVTNRGRPRCQLKSGTIPASWLIDISGECLDAAEDVDQGELAGA